MAGTEVHNLSLESSHCFCAAFSGFHVWLIRTIESPNYTKELNYSVSSLISWYYEWWDIATSLRTMPKHAGRKRGIRYRTKGEITSCKSLWSVRWSICLSEAEAESLFKMHQMFECEVRSWQHLWFSVEIARAQLPRCCLYSHEKGLIQRPRQTGPCGAEVDRSFSESPVKSQQPGYIKLEQDRLETLYSKIPCCHVPCCPPYQKIPERGQSE